MKELLSELYQVLGELNAPANVLDQVAAAAAGQPLPHATLLPFAADADPIGHTTGTMHGDVNGNTFFEVKLAGRRRLPFMGQSVYVGSPPAALPDGDLPDVVIQATAEAIGDAYDCVRVWEAWGVGTMGPDDFRPVADDGDRVAEIARAAIGAWLADKAAIKDSLTADRQAEPVAWVRFCSDGCYEGPLMNSSPAMDGARRTSGAWTPLFAAQPVARDVLMAAMSEAVAECAEICDVYSSYKGARCASEIRHPIMNDKLAAIADRYAAQPPAVAVAVPDGWRMSVELRKPGASTKSMLHIIAPGGRGHITYYAQTECHEELLAMLAAAPQGAGAVPDATVGKLRLLVAACNRIEEEAEEFEGPDGLGMGIAMDYWHEFAEALTTARKALAAAQKGGAA